MVLQRIKEFIMYCETELGDPRTKNNFFVTNPHFTIGIIIIYLLLVKVILPTYMKSRKAYSLKSVIAYYNIFQVVVNAYIVYLSYGSGYIRRFPLLQCRDVDTSDTDPDAIMAFKAVYYYMLLKYTEFLDTIFFALRKKNNQISFLHLYHHTSMVINTWIVFKFIPGGGITHATGINASIHVVMYTYYLLSGLGPKWQKYLWWKKYLTTIQIIQFIIALYILIHGVITRDSCPLIMKHTVLIMHGLFYGLSLIYLFSKFYTKTYKEEPKQKININNNNAKKIK